MGYANSDYYFNDYKIYAYSKATKTRTKKATKTRTKKATKNRTEKATKTRTKKQRLRLAPKKKYSANFLREVNHKYLQHKTKVINVVFGRKCNFPSLRGDIDNRYCQDPLNYIFFPLETKLFNV